MVSTFSPTNSEYIYFKIKFDEVRAEFISRHFYL